MIFKCEIIEGHCIIRDNGHVILIDTGAPRTIHQTHSLSFLNREWQVLTNYGTDINGLRDLSGINDLTTLMGNDILGNYLVCFTCKNNAVEFREPGSKPGMKLLAMEVKVQVPVVHASVGGQELKFFLDSGARLSYLRSHIAHQFKSIGQERDFYPGLGRYTVDVYQIPVVVTGWDFNVKFGVPPSSVDNILSSNKVDGILGYDLFDSFDVNIDITNRMVFISRS